MTTYIAGDLVRLPNNVNCKILEISMCSGMTLVCSNKQTETFCNKKDISPIPLTEGILNANGWFGCGDTYTKDITGSVGLRIDSWDGKWVVYMYVPGICNYHSLLRVDYVHELQHLLFGLGLSSDLRLEKDK